MKLVASLMESKQFRSERMSTQADVASRPPEPSAPGPSDFAFIAVVPVAVVLVAIGAWIAPALIKPPAPGTSGLRFFSGVGLSPEPLEQARFFLFLLSIPAVIVMSVILSRLVRPLAKRRLIVLASLLVEVVGVAGVLWCWRGQQSTYQYFPASLLLLSASAAVGAVVALYQPSRPRRALRLLPSRRTAAIAACLAAGLITVVGLLPSLFHETNIARGLPVVHYHLRFTMDEFAAVANGRTPLVDFIPQYTNVLPYLLAPILSIVGLSVGTFTGAMFLLSGASLLSVFYVFARVSGRWTVGLMMYLPFLALSLYRVLSTGDEHVFIANYFALMPLRYFGPWLVAGLVVWQIGRPSARRVVLFAVAAAVMLNNIDFGIPAFAASVGATWLGGGRTVLRSPAWAGRVLGSALAGLAIAVGVMVAISLLRTGYLPDFVLSLNFARMFAVSGFYMLPMPTTGLHLVMALTFAGSLLRAVFRAASALHQEDRARLLTASLAYGAVFGLGASSYFVGRSHPHVLVALFSAWGFVLVLLAWDAWTDVRRAEGTRSPERILWAAPSVLIIAHLLLAVAPTWEMRGVGRQVARIMHTGEPSVLLDEALVRFVRRHTDPGETVLLLTNLSHRTALRAGVRDAFPYNNVESVITYSQLDVVRDRLRDENVEKVFSAVPLAPEFRAMLAAEGFRPGAPAAGAPGPVLWNRPAISSPPRGAEPADRMTP